MPRHTRQPQRPLRVALLTALASLLLPVIVRIVLKWPPHAGLGEVAVVSALGALAAGGAVLLLSRPSRAVTDAIGEAARAELAALITSSLDLGEVFSPFVERLRSHLPADRATLALLTDRGDEFRIVALSSRQRTELEQTRQFPLDGSRVAAIVGSGQAGFLPDLSTLDLWDCRTLASEGFRSSADIPLHAPLPAAAGRSSRVIGVFSVASLQTAAFGPAELNLLQALEPHLASALANAREHEEATARVRRLELAHRLDEALSASLDVADLLRAVSDYAVHTMTADRALALLPQALTEEGIGITDQLLRLVGPGVPSDQSPRRLADFGPMVSAVIERRAPMLSRQVSEESVMGTPLESFHRGEGIAALAVVPLLLGERCLGALLVGWRQEGAATQESLQVLQALAERLALALRNVGLAEALRDERTRREGMVTDG